MKENKISTKDIPCYNWPTKKEGKAQYPKFAKDFQGTLKGLWIVVGPGGIDRYLGVPPGRRPNNADERAEWLAKSNNQQLPEQTRHGRNDLCDCTRSFGEVVSLWYHPEKHYRQSFRETSRRPTCELDLLSQAVPQSTDSATEHSNAYGCATL